ncbi:tripartite tricarboxylate transporter substrate-binding protein [Chelativorans alearense]|uniref:tripartite tricarboxylate transporter substrate-binding protein n=1 Tax=Chelativorans alearense TaxID=2681495 RepID=UPI0013D431C0|nr:tripartite tricarboxylate transporter substrate-binding protein [Chelativorans alearense]
MPDEAAFMNRRGFFKIAGSVVAASAIGGAAGQVIAANYPSRTFDVIVPTREGGGADGLSRAFINSWKDKIGQDFERQFSPGAAGQVGYELYFKQREMDGSNLLFGNVSAEMIMYALQKPDFRFPEDIYYFCGIDTDPCGIWVSGESPFTSVEEVVETAMKRPVSIAVSRLPHPGTIGLLALAEATGAQFNIVPYGGGNPQVVAVLNGEAECGGGGTAGYIEGARILGVFDREEFVLAETRGDVPLINEVFGTDIPSLYSTRSWAVHRSWADANPDDYKVLQDTSAAVFDDPRFKEEIVQSGVTPWDGVRFRDQSTCMALAQSMVELATKYGDQLTAG